MILADGEIKKRISSWEIWIESDPKYDIFQQIWPASFDFRLWNIFKYHKKNDQIVIDTREWVKVESIWISELKKDEKFILHPGCFVLASTLETFSIPNDLVARCEWRSSLWRLWLIIHSTAWFIDPWFSWTITLEMTNINEVPIAIYPWMRIWQLAFETLMWKCLLPYDIRKGSKYMWQVSPEASKIDKDLY